MHFPKSSLIHLIIKPLFIYNSMRIVFFAVIVVAAALVGTVLFLSDSGFNETDVSIQSDTEEIINIEKECKFFNQEYDWIDSKVDHAEFLCKYSDFDFLESWHVPYHPSDNEVNKFGFRGSEFSDDKLLDVYRIFVVGGSTVFGDGVENYNTIPSYLQDFYSNDQFDNIKAIEVINAGVNGATSKHESLLIKNKLSKMSPDMVIVYDGWNDSKIGNYDGDASWANRWIDICDSYSEEFDIIITLQPVLSKTKTILTDQEFTNYYTREAILKEKENLGKLAMNLSELNLKCSSSHDLRYVMDNEHVGIFYDQGHMTPIGNKKIAKKLYEITLPIKEKNSPIVTSLNDKKINSEPQNTRIESDQRIDFRGKIIEKENFSSIDISKIIAYFSRFIETDFSSSNLREMDSKFSKFFNVDFSDAELQNSRISRSTFSQSDFSSTDFSDSYISTSSFNNSDLTDSTFLNSNLNGVKIIDSILENTNFENADISHSYLENLDFTKTYLQDTKFIGARFMLSSFDGIDFSTLEIHGDSLSPTEFIACTITHSTFSEINMDNVDFTPKVITSNNESTLHPGSDLSNSLFLGSDLRKTMFSINSNVQEGFFDFYDISQDHYKEFISVKFDYSKFYNVNLSNNDLGLISLRHSEVIDSDLTNTFLKNSDLSFSSIVNSNLSGANLEGANLEGANLEGVNLDGANLNCLNHPVCLNQ